MTVRGKPAYKETIVSLTPALPGWRALTVGSDENGDSVWLDDVAAWALMEHTADGYRYVEGLVSCEMGLESAEAIERQFLRYLSPGQTSEDFASEIAERQAELREDRRARRAS